MATHEEVQEPEIWPPLTGEALDRYRSVYLALWGVPFKGGAVTHHDLGHLSDLLDAKRGRGDAVGFR